MDTNCSSRIFRKHGLAISQSSLQDRHILTRWRRSPGLSLTVSKMLIVIFISLVCWTNTAVAAFVEFQNCLDSNIVNSNPLLLQFVPLNVTAVFDTSTDAHNLNVTVYGNVTGQSTAQTYPPPNDPSWTDPTNSFGKITNVSVSNNKYTTLFTQFDVLTYTPYNAEPAQFCQATFGETCPLAPAFFVEQTDLARLPAFSVSHDMNSSYSFTSITASLRVQSGDASGQYYACISATITPDLGSSLKAMLRYLPLAVLGMVGLATVTAAILSPWGSADIFHWSSNFGRDEDLLRLVTPGFADCLQYIQFIILTGSLSLEYPGFYQPVVSRIGWSSLMFQKSFVTKGNGTETLIDGIYQLRPGTIQGLDRMSQLIGMTSPSDIWAGMMVWLVVIIGAVIILTQIGFAFRWVFRHITNVPAEDLRSKNGPFTAGNVVRIVMNYFLLPLVALSCYQLVIASSGPTYAVALSVIVLVAIIAFSIRLIFLFIRVRPRSFLFDDLLTVLAYGPLYNTFSDDAAFLSLVPVFVNFLRGIAIGAVQPSGVAQVVLLAICEIILILTINAFRPFPSATSMNIYHTCFAAIRFLTVMLSIAFVPSLGVGDSSRGWIGYAILLVHACVLVFGFFLNAVQTLIEVIARLAGAGGRSQVDGGAARGGLNKVFGMRQLSRRVPRRDTAGTRQSMASGAAMLQNVESHPKDVQMSKVHSQSISGSSAMLLDGGKSYGRMSQGLESPVTGRITPEAASTFSKSNRLSGATSPGGIIGLSKPSEAKDPYYRPPRRNTLELLQMPEKQRASIAKAAALAHEEAIEDDAGEGSATPARGDRDDFEEVGGEYPRPKTDYAVREVDFYYGVRGPALSSGTRKLKTGPADPTGPVSSATGWFKGLMGRKTKEKTKGFEVVRSARVPPPGLLAPNEDLERGPPEPYHDDPETPIEGNQERIRSPILDRAGNNVYDDVSLDDEDEVGDESDTIAARPPSLPLIDSVGAIELPSRIGSTTSRNIRGKSPAGDVYDLPPVPALPRKSSKRTSSHGSSEMARSRLGLPTVPDSQRNSTASSSRLPFSSPLAPGNRTKRYSTGADSTTSSFMQPMDDDQDAHMSYAAQLRHTSSALGQHAADFQADRPSNMGFVQQHRASDNIHYGPDSPEFEGSTAEVYDGSKGKETMDTMRDKRRYQS